MQWSEPPAEQHPKRRISLSQQIEEVDQELQRRQSEYHRLVAREKLRQSEADYQVERLQAVRATLEWLHVNEDVVRWAIANRDAIKERMEGDRSS